MNDTVLKLFAVIIAAMNVLAYSLMGIDKLKAKKHSRRIPEKVLFAVTALFGGLGGTLGMYAFHHKTKHWYFAVFFPLFAVAQLAALVFLYIKAFP